MADARGFGEGFAQGFGLMDDYFRKNKAEKRDAARDAENDRRWQSEFDYQKTKDAADAARQKEKDALDVKVADARIASDKAAAEQARVAKDLLLSKKQDEDRARRATELMMRIHQGDETVSAKDLAELREYNPVRFVRPDFTNAVTQLTKVVTDGLRGQGATDWNKQLDSNLDDINRVYLPRIRSTLPERQNGRAISGYVIDDVEAGKPGELVLHVGYETADGRRGTLTKNVKTNDMLDFLQGNAAIVQGMKDAPAFRHRLAALATAMENSPENAMLRGEAINAYAALRMRLRDEADAKWMAAAQEAATQGTAPPGKYDEYMESYMDANLQPLEVFAQQYMQDVSGDFTVAKKFKDVRNENLGKGIDFQNARQYQEFMDWKSDNDIPQSEIDQVLAAYKAKGGNSATTWGGLKGIIVALDDRVPRKATAKFAQMLRDGQEPPPDLVDRVKDENRRRANMLKELLNDRLNPGSEAKPSGSSVRGNNAPDAVNPFAASGVM